MSEQSDQISQAQPKDPTEIEGLFYSTDLAFISAALLAGEGISILKVLEHPQRIGQKAYYLKPEDKVRKFQLDYVSGNVKVDPSQLTTKMGFVRNLPVDRRPSPPVVKASTFYEKPPVPTFESSNSSRLSGEKPEHS